ncbi:MAG: hypothetical protein SOZ89_05535 [Peptoniphilaceae bacterium]|nr:hypothetical protein [Peptoniphilaceae bacterium]MDY3738566.1 hypothetical protein [Peptoniphilaceae bacterium]
MKKIEDPLKNYTKEEIEKKEHLLDKDNLEKNDKLAMFLAAIKVFGLPLLIMCVGIILLAKFFGL